MQIGSRLVDGSQNSFTGAQYINSAYRVPSRWTNKAEMKAGGTIRVKQNMKIKKGEEILFAYHTGYWHRWGTRKRGRPPKDSTLSTTTSAAQPTSELPPSNNLPCAHTADNTDSSHVASNTIDATATTIQEANGIRVTQPADLAVKGRGGRPKKARDHTPHRANKRQATQYAWNAVSRDEFNQRQRNPSTVMSVQQSQNQQRFERGEGGGVT